MKSNLTFSISVMAHESRAHLFPYLRERLGDVPFFVDDDKLRLGTWNNCKRAWLARDHVSDYHLVIQDDAVLCENFLERVSELINKNSSPAYQLFAGKEKESFRYLTPFKRVPGGAYQGQMLWGLAIILRQDLVDEMMAWGQINHGRRFPDDTRIKKFLDHKKIRTTYPYPSLVDHRTINSLVDNRELRVAERFIDAKHIPKKIHQIWIGDKRMPTEWINTWDLPGWEHIIWNEQRIDQLGLKNRKQYDYYYQRGQYHGASDVARLEILERYGGMYIDADTERIGQIDGDYLYSDLFAVDESDMRAGLGSRIANGIIGCQPNSPTIQEYIKRISYAKELEPIWKTIGGTMFTQAIQDVAEPRVAILESFWFLPISYTGKKHPRAKEAIAIHHWGTTHNIYKGLHEL